MYRYLVLLALNIRADLERAQPGVPTYFRPLPGSRPTTLSCSGVDGDASLEGRHYDGPGAEMRQWKKHQHPTKLDT